MMAKNQASSNTGTRSPIVMSGTHEGIAWEIRRVMWGALNGYARLTETHPYRGIDLTHEQKFLVHGGITYQIDDGWIGFDTLHAGDEWPEMPKFMKRNDYLRTRWTSEMVVREVHNLCEQIAKTRESMS